MDKKQNRLEAIDDGHKVDMALIKLFFFPVCLACIKSLIPFLWQFR